MRIHYLHTWIALLPMLLLCITTSCMQDDGIQGDAGHYDNQILIRISTGNQIITRAASDIEEVIETLHLFVFEMNPDETLPATASCCYYHSLENVDITKPVSLGSKESFAPAKKYKVCLIANYNLPDAVKQQLGNEENPLPLSELNTLIEREQSQLPFASPEALLMEGESGAVTLNDGTAQPIEVPATLTRATAKIVLNIKLADEFVDKYTPYTGMAVANNRITFTNPALTTYVRSGQGIYPSSVSGSFSYNYAIEQQVYSITYTLYSYACEWLGGDLETASSLVINIPVQPVEPSATPLDINSYAISLDKFSYQTADPAPSGNGDSRDYSLQRNYAYTITATVRALGSNEPSEPVKLEGAKFEAMPWGQVDININGEDSGDFLSLNYHELSLTDDTENSVLHFDASDDVTVELDGEVYYYNKFGQKKIVGEGGNRNDPTYGFDVDFKYDNNSVEGNITIESKPLPNNAPKYFRIKITNNHDRNLVEYVDVVQYPLNYVTSTFGYYSSLRDTDGEGCDFLTAPTSDNSRYTRELSGNILRTGAMVTSGSVSNRDVFVAKYVDWNEVAWGDDGNPTLLSGTNALDYYYSSRNSDRWESSELSSRGAYYRNPRMYHIRITASSDNYTLGVPPLDKDGYTQAGTDVANMVSPSFMIASQLGAFQRTTFNLSEAKKHCSLYEETTFLDYQEGIAVKYTNWRIPTSAELDIIGDIQKGTGEATDYDAIDEVLAYDRYWCSSGVWLAPGSDEEESGTPAVRCVRDANEPGTIIHIKEKTPGWPATRPSVTPN